MDEENSVDSTERQMKKAGKDIARKAGNTAKRGIKNMLKKALKNASKFIGWKGIAIGIIIIILGWFIYNFVSLFIVKEKFHSDSSSIVGDLTGGGEQEDDDDEYEYEDENANITTGNVRKLVTIEGRKLILNTDEFNSRITKWLEENNEMEPEALGLSEDYRELKAFLEAEVVTLYPDLRERSVIEAEQAKYEEDRNAGLSTRKKLLEQDELQGCVKFRRRFETGGDPVYLEYMPYEEYKAQVAELGILLDSDQTNDGVNVSISDEATRTAVEAKYDYLKDKFTLDNEQNLLLISLSSSLTTVEYSPWAIEEEMMYSDGTVYNYTYNIKITRVNYQSLVEKYTMPFELCVAFLMTTESADFCTAIADLALNSNIVFDVLDTGKTEIITKKYSYTANYWKYRRWEYYEEYDDPDEEVTVNGVTSTVPGAHHKEGPKYYNNTGTETKDVNDYEIIHVTKKSTTTSVRFNLVDTWLFYYNYEYTYQHNDLTQVDTYTMPDEPYDDENSTEVPNYHNLEWPEYKGPQSNSARDITNVKVVKEELKETKKNQIWNITEEVESSEYIPGPKAGRFSPEKFLSLVKVDPTNINQQTNEAEFNLYDNSKNTEYIFYKSINEDECEPIDNIMSVEGFFYYLVNNNNKTKADFAEILEYIFDLYYGYETYDESKFSEYEPGDFVPVPKPGEGGGGTWHYGSTVREKIFYAVVDAGFSEYAAAGVAGYCFGESSYSTTATNPSSGAYGIAQWLGDRKTRLFEYASNNGIDVTDEDYQISYMIAEILGNGEFGSKPQYMSAYSEPYNMWKNSDDSNGKGPEDAEHGFLRWFGRPATTVESVLNFPRQTGRETEARAVYNEFHGKERTGGGQNIPAPENESSFVTVKHRSGITGKVFTVYKQNCTYPGYPETGKLFTGSDGGHCNRAAAASIISGYYNGTAGELVSSYLNTLNSIKGNNVEVSKINAVYNAYGLKASGNYFSTGRNLDINDIRNQLLKGGYMQIWLKGSNPVKGTTGTKWTSKIHWVAIIDYQKVGDKEYIYVSNSGKWQDTGDKLNDSRTDGQSGWYPINEFSTTNIVYAALYVDPA